jgi:hypothetical protein
MWNLFDRLLHPIHGASDLLDYAAMNAPLGVSDQLDAAIQAATPTNSWLTILEQIATYLLPIFTSGVINWQAIIAAIWALLPTPPPTPPPTPVPATPAPVAR